MPNDAKLGLIVGVGLVIAVAVVFFRKEPVTAQAPQVEPPAAAVSAPAGRGQLRAVPAKKTTRSEDGPSE